MNAIESTRAEDLFDAMQMDIEREFTEAAEAMRDDVRQKLSVPVDKSSRPWKRSRPGEFARKDTGNLIKSLAAMTHAVGGVVESIVYTDAIYGGHLEAINRQVLTSSSGPWLDLLAAATSSPR